MSIFVFKKKFDMEEKKKKNIKSLYNLERGELKFLSKALGINYFNFQDTLNGKSKKRRHIIDPILKDWENTKKRFIKRALKKIGIIG